MFHRRVTRPVESGNKMLLHHHTIAVVVCECILVCPHVCADVSERVSCTHCIVLCPKSFLTQEAHRGYFLEYSHNSVEVQIITCICSENGMESFTLFFKDILSVVKWLNRIWSSALLFSSWSWNSGPYLYPRKGAGVGFGTLWKFAASHKDQYLYAWGHNPQLEKSGLPTPTQRRVALTNGGVQIPGGFVNKWGKSGGGDWQGNWGGMDWSPVDTIEVHGEERA